MLKGRKEGKQRTEIRKQGVSGERDGIRVGNISILG
jgi:hypothetical protein